MDRFPPAAVPSFNDGEKMRQISFDDWKAQINQATDWLFPEYAAGFNHIPKYAAIIPHYSHRTSIPEQLRRYRGLRSAVGR